MDFTINTYRALLQALMAQGYTFQTFDEFLVRQEKRSIILRHDVEAKYANALIFARIQSEYKIRGTYFYRILPNHFNEEIIKQIAGFGHETGYHYDDFSYCKGDYEKAILRFRKNLETLRKITGVKTICMEGAPLSKWDNRDLWRRGDGETGGKGDRETGRQGDREKRRQGEEETVHASRLTPHYRDFGLIGEPYFDLDFSKVLYLTDTGRRWDGGKVSVRDKVQSSKFKVQSSKLIGQRSEEMDNNSTFNPPAGGQHSTFHSTFDIINAANASLLPDQIMFTFHPQRWTDKPLPWLQELVMQNVKNLAKRVLLSVKG